VGDVDGHSLSAKPASERRRERPLVLDEEDADHRSSAAVISLRW
jgi:hypothetical protein